MLAPVIFWAVAGRAKQRAASAAVTKGKRIVVLLWLLDSEVESAKKWRRAG